MTSRNFPVIPPSSLPNGMSKDAETVEVSQEPAKFEELGEFRPDADGNAAAKGRRRHPASSWLASSKGVLIWLGMGAIDSRRWATRFSLSDRVAETSDRIESVTSDLTTPVVVAIATFQTR